MLFFTFAHFLFDLLANYFSMPTEIYRLLIFRYFIFILFGIVLYYYFDRLSYSLKYTTFISIIYILAYSLGYRMELFSKWPNTALPTVFWALTIVVFAMNYLEKKPTNRILFLFNRLGKASYHIFLTQKILFGFGLNKVLERLELPVFLRAILAIVICCFLGLVFYRYESEKLLE